MLKTLFLIALLIGWVEIFSQEEEIDPCKAKPSKKAEKLYQKAIEELQSNNYREANELLNQSIEIDPEYLQALWVIADVNTRSYNRTAIETNAIESYQKIIQTCPSFKNYVTYLKLGNLYYDDTMYAKAGEMYDAFLSAKTDKTSEKDYNFAEERLKYSKFYSDVYGKKIPFNPRAIGGITTDKDEYLPYITPDNEYAYFTRRYPERRVGAVQGDDRIEKFMIAERTSPNGFTVGNALPSPFNEQPNEGGACLTIDNKELYYTRCILQNQYFNCDICYSRYEGGAWSEIETLSENINYPDTWESMPTISSDGKTLIFVSDRKGGQGGFDLYMSTKNEEGKWSKAVNMGPAINTAGNEKSPFLHSDSKTLYFSSADRETENQVFPGHLGLGAYDIFYTRLDGKNSWTAPKNIGYPINTEESELGFFVSTDGKTGYFAKSKFLGQDDWNIYAFDLYQEAQPEKVLFIKGELKDEESKQVMSNASIEIKNVQTKEITAIPVDRETGKYAAVVLFNSDFTMTVKQEGYTYVTKYISENDKTFQIPVNVNVNMQAIQVGKSYNLDDIYFDTDKDNLTESSKRVIEGFYEFLKENPKVKVEIQGHTDNVGSDEYNQKLSESRAMTVYNLLISMGISSQRLKFKGYGEAKPIADNSTEDGRSKNRRTVFVITEK